MQIAHSLERLMLIAEVHHFISMREEPHLRLVQASFNRGQFKLAAHGHPPLMIIDVCNPAHWKKPSFKARFLRRATSVARVARHFPRPEGEDAILRAARWGLAAKAATKVGLPCTPEGRTPGPQLVDFTAVRHSRHVEHQRLDSPE